MANKFVSNKLSKSDIKVFEKARTDFYYNAFLIYQASMFLSAIPKEQILASDKKL